MKKYVRIACCFFVGLIIGIIVGNTAISNYRCRREITEMHEDIDELNRNFAIMELSELRGRVKEIEYISLGLTGSNNQMQEELISELESLKSYDLYFRDFEISINLPITPSNIGDICENIISQIDNEIHTIIMFGGEDA